MPRRLYPQIDRPSGISSIDILKSKRYIQHAIFVFTIAVACERNLHLIKSWQEELNSEMNKQNTPNKKVWGVCFTYYYNIIILIFMVYDFKAVLTAS